MTSPPQSANKKPAKKRFNKGAFYRTCRMLHGYLSAAAFLLLMFFAASGLLLNHPSWFGADSQDAEPIIVALDFDALQSAQSSETPERAFEELVRNATRVQGQLKDASISDSDAMLRFAGVKGGTDIFIDFELAEAEVETSKANLTSIIHDLHRGKDAGKVWKFMIDITAILILAMSVIGLILFFSLRFRLGNAIRIMGATMALFIALFVFFVP
ncbi:MAG: PepSY-associated TM helix domain-containing protein [Henriciella sp.]|nr:PepSY-associated TM helix domain-containing protein [Henriciella sp.]